MRRGQSVLRAFAHGLMLAALPVAAFLVIDHFIAPPATSSAGHSAAGRTWVDRGPTKMVNEEGDPHEPRTVADDVAQATGFVRSQVTSLINAAARESTSGSRSSLVVSIQEELRRVGCFDGYADGTWNEKTKDAMRAFNASVRVNVPADRADYLLLTLLQGHSSKACAPSCAADRTRAGACLEPSLEARALAPALRRSEISNPVRSPSATTVVDVAPSQAAAGPAVISNRDGILEDRLKAGEATARDVSTSSAPLPGRMAIGAIDSAASTSDPASQAQAEALTVENASSAAAAQPKPAVAGASRVKRSFSFRDLGSSAP